MEDQYVERIKDIKRDRQYAFRAPSDWLDKLKIVAEIEEVKVTHLFYEGIMRVLDARKNNPEYTEEIRILNEKKIENLYSKFKEFSEIIESVSPTDSTQ